MIVKPASAYKNVFDSTNAPLRRTSSGGTEQEPRKFRNLKHQNNARKKSMRELEPRIETLDLKDTQTGESISSSIMTPTDRTNPASRSAQSNSARPAPSTPMEVSTQPRNNAAQHSPLTCWFWEHDGSCRFRDSCGLAHDRTGRPSVYKNKSQTLITCPHWYNGGGCNKHEDFCIYAHKITDYLASTGPQHPIRRLNKTHAPETAFKAKSCHFWFFNGFCGKSEERCKFAHALRDYVAPIRNEDPPLSRDYPELCALRAPSGTTEEEEGRKHYMQEDGFIERARRSPSHSPPPRPRLPSEERASQSQGFTIPFSMPTSGKSPVEVSAEGQDRF